jgi:tetratricopeptide (TPR) repeat protein
MGEWNEAKMHFSEAIALDDSNYRYWVELAAVLAQLDDAEGYQEHCQKMLTAFGDTNNFLIAREIAKASLFFRATDSNTDSASELAERAVQKQDDHLSQLIAALADYRREKYASALARIEKCLAHSELHWSYEVPAHCLRAMALRESGESERGQAAITRANELMEAELPANESGQRKSVGAWWMEGLIATSLLKEAAAIHQETK